MVSVCNGKRKYAFSRGVPAAITFLLVALVMSLLLASSAPDSNTQVLGSRLWFSVLVVGPFYVISPICLLSKRSVEFDIHKQMVTEIKGFGSLSKTNVIDFGRVRSVQYTKVGGYQAPSFAVRICYEDGVSSRTMHLTSFLNVDDAFKEASALGQMISRPVEEPSQL